jgi:hypothetical protein
MPRQKNPKQLTMRVPHAAESLDMSVSAYRREYIHTGEVATFSIGGRGDMVLVEEHEAAVRKRIEAQRADPSLKIPRNGGAKLAAEGRIGSPNGCKGGKVKVSS